MRLLLFLTFVVVCAGQSSAQAKTKNPIRENIEWLDVWVPNTNDTTLPRVLLIGNSITRAYYGEVQSMLEGKAYVARLATSKSVGDPGLLSEIALVLSYGKFDVVHFNNGMHGFGYSEAEYEAAFPDLYKTIKKGAPEAKLIWATTTPVKCGEGMREFEERTHRIKERNRAAEAFLLDKQVSINDLFALVEDHPEYYAGGDGVHLVAIGTTAIARQVAEKVKSLLPK